MNRLHYPLCVFLLLGMMATELFAQDGRLGNMQLLPGYKHQTRQGIDSLIGEISKPNGLRFGYEIGRVTKPGRARTGGSFIDGPLQQPKDQIRWYREQTVNGQPIHLAYRNDDLLLVSFPHKGLNISVRVRDANEMAEALLMIMTYPASGMVNDSSETTGDGGVIEVPPTSAVEQPNIRVTNLGPGTLRLDLPTGSTIVQPDTSISISVGTSPINLVALNDDANINLQHGGNGNAKFWDVDDQIHTFFRPNSEVRQFILAKNRSGYHLEQHDSKVIDEEQKPRDAPRAGKTTVKRGAIIVQIAEVSETHDDETVTVAEIYEVAEDFTIAHLQAPQRIDSPEAIQNFAKQITESLNQRPKLETSKLEINGHVEETKNYRKTYRSVLLIKGAWEAHGDHRVFKIFGEGIMLVNPSNSANFKWRRASSFTPDR